MSPFSSERKWSGADFGPHGTWVIGAPDILTADIAVRELAHRSAATGHRTLPVARTTSLDERARPGDLPIALVTFSEPVKPDAMSTMQFLLGQGLTVKVLSGDHPATVTAVAAQVGLSTTSVLDATGRGVDERFLDDAVAADVVGRVNPQQKSAIVTRLQGDGHTVAMTGDGVNDLLALKDADVGSPWGREARRADRWQSWCSLVTISPRCHMFSVKGGA